MGSLTKSFWPHYGPGVHSASNRNEYQEYFVEGKGGRCVGLTNLPHLCSDFLEIWEPQPPASLRVCSGLWLGRFFTFSFVPNIRYCLCHWRRYVAKGRSLTSPGLDGGISCLISLLVQELSLLCTPPGLLCVPAILAFQWSWPTTSPLHFKCSDINWFTHNCTWSNQRSTLTH